jgi:outer membrane protein assembly factor BamB
MPLRRFWSLVLALLVAAPAFAAEPPPAVPGQRLPMEPGEADKLGYVANWYQNLELPASQRVVEVTRLDDLLIVREAPRPMISAVDISDGELRWQQELGRPTDRFHAPVRRGDRILVPKETDLFELHARTGEVERHLRFDFVVAGDPALVNNILIYPSTGGTLIGFHLDHRVRVWKHAMPRALHAPMVQRGGVVYATDSAGNYAAFDGVSGTKQWQRRTFDAVRGAPAIDSDTVYVPSTDSSLYAVNRQTGADRWVYHAEVPLEHPVYRLGRHLLATVPGKGLVALDHASGDQRWHLKQRLIPVSQRQGQLLLFRKAGLTLVRADVGVVITEASSDPLHNVVAGPEGSVILITEDGRLQRLNFSN